MTKITPPASPTVSRIYAAYEAAHEAAEWRRPHLGASQIGKSCDRALWFGFRWSTRPNHEGRILRLFSTGQREEERMCADLRAAGVEVMEVDPDTGKQWQVSAVGGHFGGSMDGLGTGFEEDPYRYHVLEFKTSSAKKFGALTRQGVAVAQPEHYAQMQTYMHLSGFMVAFYLAVNKDTDQLYGERIVYDEGHGERLEARAESIVRAPVPPAGVSDDPSYYECAWCDHRQTCHQGRPPEVSCRTCVHATPEMDGDARWSCALLDMDLSVEDQRRGCGLHLYIPDLLPWPVEDADAEANWISYRGGTVNGEHGQTSEEIREGWPW